jgi:uncharacterized protein (TIGR00375 family)
MELIVDLHVHSRYSMATSRNSDLEGLYFWGKLKGINIIGTGDFTHPEWFREISSKLQPVDGGLYRLKPEFSIEIDKTLPLSVRDNVIRFVPTVEIATIYNKFGRVRKLHQLIVMPDFNAVKKLNARLEKIGNLKADGRPILGLDSKELLRMCLETDTDALYIPAHIWTPWFGLFGSKSGFDSAAEAYGELTPEIRAIETGLSSDPAMNRRLRQLDGIALTSHSDAHSPQKLGREATVLDCELTYGDIIGAIKSNDKRLKGTIEFFPEEGKYHHDGHRKCGVRFSPEETKSHGGICPVCGKPLVVGVSNRAGELADRPISESKSNKTVEYIVPLPEIIAEIQGARSTAGKAVQSEYARLIAYLGDEFGILRKLPIESIGIISPRLADAVGNIRNNNVFREPGYDGVYGTIKVFDVN